jgi:hypothetical protein
VKPTPLADQCLATCASLEVAGPAFELPPPYDESSGQSAVTFGGGHWYAAWGGRPSVVTQLQRFTATGELDGPTKRIDGTTPRELLWNDASTSPLTLFGWVPPAYTPAGMMLSVHALGADLAGGAAPLLLRASGDLSVFEDVSLGASGDIVYTRALARPRPLLREVRLAPSVQPGQTLPLVDWPSSASGAFFAVDRVQGQRVAVDFDAGASAVRVTRLTDDGKAGVPAPVLTLPSLAPSVSGYVVFSKVVGGTWWVGAWAAQYGGTTLFLQAVAPAQFTTIGDPIRIEWPGGTPYGLYDAAGTPLVLGDIGSGGGLPAFVPIDTRARSACKPIVLGGGASGGYLPRAIHFEGSTAGIVLQGDSKMVFTRLVCKGT